MFCTDKAAQREVNMEDLRGSRLDHTKTAPLATVKIVSGLSKKRFGVDIGLRLYLFIN